MRMSRLLSACAALLLATGCSATTSSFVHTDTTLGRVVVYRNGVAYFERSARVDGDILHLSVPADKVDDFLKSLTVIDARTNEPAPIAYPTQVPAGEDGLIDMQIRLQGPSPHDLRLSYVTEAPAWKPSYRVVLGEGGKVSLQAWAIIDNTSGEDWTAVKLGVGASSALSFRFDLWSVRQVQRETLSAEDMFAQAPPTGGSTHSGQPYRERKVIAELTDAVLAAGQGAAAPADDERTAGGPTSVVDKESGRHRSDGKGKPKKSRPSPAGKGGASGGKPGSGLAANRPADEQERAEAQLVATAKRVAQMRGQVVIEGYAGHADGDKFGASLDRANKVRDQLVRNGVSPDKVVAVGKGEAQGRAAGVRLVEAPASAQPAEPREGADGAADPAAPASGEPIGTSHFESLAPMTLARGSSAMVSILQADADGEVVYLYDPESPRGNTGFPFRSVRLRNPTSSALETGPVTVFGEGRFIGEGLTEAIPAHQIAFVPFALDRQIVVERKDDQRDEISRIISVQRGVFSTEVQHTRKTTLTLTNRLQEKSVVYVRHTVPQGYKLTRSPPAPERLGEAHLFRIELEPGSKTELEIEEATPVFKSTDIRSSEGMSQVKLFLSSAAAQGPLKERVADLIKAQQDIGSIEQQIATLREQMGEYRSRMDELHAQLVTLRAVKGSGGGLMSNLEKKLQEVSDKLSKSTVDLVGHQERLMVARIKFQDGVAELSLEKQPEVARPEAPSSSR
jgi:flagellar biosynthesis chaperone FliJ